MTVCVMIVMLRRLAAPRSIMMFIVFYAGNHYSVTHSRFKLRSGSVIRRRGESRRRSWWPCGVEPGSKHGTLDFSAGPAA